MWCWLSVYLSGKKDNSLGFKNARHHFLEIYCHPPPPDISRNKALSRGFLLINNLLIRPYLLGVHWAGTLRFSWLLLIWVPWSQWILKIDAGCNHQTCFDSYVVISILEDGSLVSSRSFMPLCYLKESRQCLKEPVILSNQKKREVASHKVTEKNYSTWKM